MAASLPFFLMEQNQGPTKINIESGSSKSEPASNRGRKPNKGPPACKKQPQRGMGVAKLENLRFQERLKQMKETQLESFNVQSAQSIVPDPIHSVPIQFGQVSYGVPMFNGGGFLGFDQGLLVKRIGNGGFAELNDSPGSGQFLVNPYVFRAPDMSVRGGTTAAVLGTSKELSSMPKLMQHHEHSPSDVCFKKKRFNEENIGYNNGMREKFAEISSTINGSDFLGLNPENHIDLNDQMGGFSTRAARSALYASHNDSEGVEVVAIHRKGNPTSGSVLMEYEFFPGKKSGKSSTRFEEMEFPAEASVALAGGGEASCVTTSDYSGCSASNAASNSVDLSLKLSY
ncbi:hypothetical protein P3X46_027074 [Hevea brasiliensis]|uniref:Uncharacterized protein n=2 Tax=Hevea brasiliensis TaxID=3981 RepID=A0ABQ9L0Y9_HEVBR|nr:protein SPOROCYTELESS-like [Hevea brasiliensis]KAF2314274.1 hypothetical protein GH714_024840 [Hevea brasiliensis]KAJ9153656.1 hypothetical protein P3X46_027074 [Hevea brasiliensis]